MKKISQAIIGATLILDVAVVFTFGLAVISSYEDGSRLPETTFVRKASEGRVAGETNALQINIIDLYDQITLNSPVIVKARTTVALPIGHTVYFNVKNNLVNSSGYTPAVLVTGTILDWQKEMNMPVGSYSIYAEARSSSGSVLAVSPTITINISDNNASISVPSITLNSPSSGTISGIKEISGALSNFSSSYSMPIKELQVWQGSTWKKNFPLTRNANNQSNLAGSMDTATLSNGDYSLKIHIIYNDGTADKPLDSALTNVTVSNAGSTNSAYSTNTNTSTGTGDLANTNTSASSGNSTDTSSTSGTNTNSTASTNASTGTSGSANTNTSPSTNTSTTAVNSATIVNPVSSTILRSRDNPLIAKTSIVVSGLKFIVHKSDEPVDQIMLIDAVSSDKINWKANMNLTVFKDGAYDITAVSGDIRSAPVNVIVQKVSLSWINPQFAQPPQILSGGAPIRVRIGGIYEKDGITPVKSVRAYFYQTNTQAPYTEIYNEQLYQNSGTLEWRLYDWTLKREKLWKTDNSSNGKYRLIIKVINESISTSNVWFPTDQIFIEINNQQAVLPSNNNANTSVSAVNDNKNISIAANTNVSATNSVNNENTNSSAGAAVALEQIDSDKDLLSDEDERVRGTDPNSVDTDNDGLTDFVEIDKYKTDPLKKDTDGDGYLDGEEVQSGYDPLKPPTDATAAAPLKLKPVEEPKNSEKPILESLVVEKIENRENKTVPSPSTNETNTQAGTPETVENTIILTGKGPANTILTLFIYSVDPIVITVKTDDDGNWQYELDKTLEDGEHEVYVTVTDDTGKIQTQSSPIAFFVKEAKAVSPESFRADLVAREPVKTSSTDIYLIASGVLVLIAVIAGLAVALRRRSAV
ncbi:MAG TPA: Ig-like domain-containing protein [Patescibacteria group bacterium]|nr:Ig-like domain-containing protein [Patescibacteria group bacterium]